MNQFLKCALFLFFMNSLITKNEEINGNNGNITYNLSQIDLDSNYTLNDDYINFRDDYTFSRYSSNRPTKTIYIIHNYGEIGYFQALLNIIQILVGRYFDVFQACYLRSINIIYYLVTDYFLVFNRLFFTAFGQVVTLVNNIVLVNCINSYYLISLLFTTSNIAIISFLIMYILYLNHERIVMQTLNNNRIAYELRNQNTRQNQNQNQNRNRNRNRNNNNTNNVSDF